MCAYITPTDEIEKAARKKEKKNYARIIYRHECEPVIQMFNTTRCVVA